MKNEAEGLKGDVEAMLMQLSRVLVGTVSADVTYDTKYGYSDGDADCRCEAGYGVYTPSFFDVLSDLMTAQPSQTCRTNTQTNPRPVMVGGKERRREMMT
jgi:hypothetical protein